MGRLVLTILVLVALSVAGCSSLVQPQSPTPTPRTTPTPTAPPTVDCDTFGTGGVFHVAKTEASIDSVGDAERVLRAARSNGSLDEPNATEFAHVSREQVASGAVRREISALPANATLYYFSPDGETDLHEMALVADTGHIYRAFVGAC